MVLNLYFRMLMLLQQQ